MKVTCVKGRSCKLRIVCLNLRKTQMLKGGGHDVRHTLNEIAYPTLTETIAVRLCMPSLATNIMANMAFGCSIEFKLRLPVQIHCAP